MGKIFQRFAAEKCFIAASEKSVMCSARCPMLAASCGSLFGKSRDTTGLQWL